MESSTSWEGLRGVSVSTFLLNCISQADIYANVNFDFRAAIMEQNIWYQDGGGLTLVLCEDDNMKSDDTVEPCNACNEAKYEVSLRVCLR